MNKVYDFLIIGGGISGSSLAYGISNEASVAIVDAYDESFRATLGNYGLTWLQGKGYKQPLYSKMTERAIHEWNGFRDELEEKTGLDLEFHKTGGLHFCMNESEFETISKKNNEINATYESELTNSKMLDYKETKELFPWLGDTIVGSSFNPNDGHINPAKLWMAQLICAKKQGSDYLTGFKVTKIKKQDSTYLVTAEDGRKLAAAQIILTAGLGNKNLAKQLEINVPIKPQKGQILITEKLPKMDIITSLIIRQTQSGTLLLGHSNEDEGFDTNIDQEIIKKIADKSIKIMPMLKDIKLIRSWAALRIVPLDGKSIYDTIDNSLHIVSTHSAITFAPTHVRELSKSILKGEMPDILKDFSLKRFEEKK